MSYADKVFKENVKDILENGVWDTDMDVARDGWTERPRTPLKNSA